MPFLPAAMASLSPPSATSQEALGRGLKPPVPRNGEDWILFLRFLYALHLRQMPLKEQDLSWSCRVTQEKGDLPARQGLSG